MCHHNVNQQMNILFLLANFKKLNFLDIKKSVCLQDYYQSSNFQNICLYFFFHEQLHLKIKTLRKYGKLNTDYNCFFELVDISLLYFSKTTTEKSKLNE